MQVLIFNATEQVVPTPPPLVFNTTAESGPTSEDPEYDAGWVLWEKSMADLENDYNESKNQTMDAWDLEEQQR